MTDSKSHLVERVAERLLQSGALEESAAHLLGTDRAGADRAGADRAAGAADPGPGARGGRNPEPDAEGPNVPHDEAPAARSYSALDLLDRPGVPEEVAPFLGAPATLRSLELPSGPVSIDAVALERAGMVDWSRTRSRVSEEFRLVQRQILRNAFSPPGAEAGFTNLLMVTSARP